MPLRLLRPAAILALAAVVGLAACSRADDRASAPPASEAPAGPADAAAAAGGPRTLKPGSWKTVAKTPAGEESSVQCVGEGYDPGAEAARKATPCGQPILTRTADGFHLDQVCEKDGIKYDLAGAVSGDFTTTATTDLALTLSAFGRKQTMHMRAVSTYQGPCESATKTQAAR
ncbi:hypothetical protein ASD79_03275 [Caulobacter sp. Root655]|uniref:DUF3617 family protein n=1 Tax=Caulobacter sp. Root655 TaxID=1736578 RepID=UPI0006FF8B8F|nr:hypothetical protein [Caulobacter sp. Root655]KRA66315.1 hypothetical protein ASD79_03275 [Caulobacter sp. Root655]